MFMDSLVYEFACLPCEVDGWNLSLNGGECGIQEFHFENKPFRTRKTYKLLNPHANYLRWNGMMSCWFFFGLAETCTRGMMIHINV